jgi:hypothetical protein
MTYQSYLKAVNRFDAASYRARHPVESLVVNRAGDLTVEYAPFDHIERTAELVIVGLTPGRTQATAALASLASDLRNGVPVERGLANAKRTASFSGAMRGNLLAMLDAVGVPGLFGRASASEFFSRGDGLVHFTSALRYPVYIGNQNYSGLPAPLGHPVLRGIIDTHLAEEAAALPNAIWIPLGGHAEDALLHLASAGRLDRNTVLAGLPHPSGANAERIAYFLGRKDRERLSAKTNAARIDAAKQKLLGQVELLRRGVR